MLNAGREVDRYVVEGVLGRGGMAEVYRVRHTRLNSVHALKVLTLTSKGLRQRLLQEGQAQASLRHPNVVAVTDVLDVDGQPGLVMEYVDGPSLDAWLETNQPDIPTALKLFRGVVSAVQAAHAAGLVHRDLKPANVLLAPFSGELVPKVMDFGLAKALAEEHIGHGATRSGIAMGTPRYMAPEQIRDAKSVDRRADIFSLGCLLYELLTGRPPFDGPDVLEVFNRVTSGAYVPAESLVPGLPAGLDAAIRGSIVVDAARRIPDCETLLRVLDGEPFAAPPIPQAEPGTGPPPAYDSSETWAGGDAPQLRPSDPTLDLGRGAMGQGPPPGVEPRAGETLVPAAAISTPGTAGRKLGWLAAGGTIAALSVVVVLVGVALVAVGGWFGLEALHARAIRAGLERATDGEARVDQIRLRLGGLVLHGVSLQGRDGLAVVRAERVRVLGGGVFWSGPAAVERVEVDGLDIDLRRDAEGWIVPASSVAQVLAAGGGSAVGPFDVELGPARLVAQGSTGTLTGRWTGARVAGLARGSGGWVASSWTVDAPTLADHLPILEARSIHAEADTARIDGLNVWLSTSPEGWIDLPPMIADGVPAHFGGTASGDSWFDDLIGASPVPVAAVQVEAGVFNLTDTANAAGEVDWAAAVDQARVSRDGDGWRLTALGELDRGRLSVDLGPGAEGRLEGRIELRDLPLISLAPYLGDALSGRGVAIESGVVDGIVEVEEHDRALGFMAALGIEDPVLVPLTGDAAGLSRRDRRLLEARESVDVSIDGIGMLTDMEFRPIQDLLQAASDGLLAPAGRVSRTRPRANPPSVANAPRREPEPGADDATSDRRPPEAETAPPEVPETVQERWQRRRKEGQRALEDWLEKQTRR